jgi:hypothetical protein
MIFILLTFFYGCFHINPPSELYNVKAIPGNKKVTLTWDSKIDKYFTVIKITYTPGNKQIELPSWLQSYTITGLTNEVLYTFTLKTGNYIGQESAGVSITATPDIGIIHWQKMYGGSGYDNAYSICQTSDGGYIVAGSSYSTNIPGVTNNGGYDYYIIKIYD